MTSSAVPLSSGKRFLSAFRDIEGYLKRLTTHPHPSSFSDLLQSARDHSPIVRRRYKDLKALQELRNAIVHDTDNLLAEPTEKAVRLIEEIRDLLLRPPRVDTLFQQHGKVKTVDAKDPVSRAVRLMYDNNFSQLPVIDRDSVLDILTTNTIARWLGAQVAEDIFSLEESSVEEVLQYREEGETWRCIPRDSSLVEVAEFFEQELRQGHRPVALIVTHSGKRHEKPIGIITPWDLPEIYRRIGEVQ